MPQIFRKPLTSTINMDVEKYAPFTSSPLDASRGRGRRFMLPRLRSVAATNSVRRTESTPTVVVYVSTQQPTKNASSTQQTTQQQVGGYINGTNTK